MNGSESFLGWLAENPQDYLLPIGLVLAGAAAAVLAPWLRDRLDLRPRADWRWGLVLLAILAAGRWPSILTSQELNPDECQMFAGAHALVHDPVFWRSVDGVTAGPLDFFVLWPAGWCCGWDSYLGPRLTALGLLAFSLTLTHQCLALLFGPSVARLATLPAAALGALVLSSEVLPYSTELLPMVWLAAAAWAAIRRWRFQGGPGWCLLGGVALGAVPFSKLQAAPLALVAGVCWLVAEFRDRAAGTPRHRLGLLAGAVLPMVAFVGPVVLVGEWNDFVVTFLLSNFQYATSSPDTLGVLLQKILHQAGVFDHQPLLWSAGLFLWGTIALLRRPVPGRAFRGFILAAGGVTLLSLACILRAGRPFLHYWQLAVLPATFLLGALLAGLVAEPARPAARLDRRLMAACAALLLGALLVERACVPNFYARHLAYLHVHPRSDLAERVRAHARPGESIAIWGWSNYVYVETGLRQATRDAHFERAIIPGSLRDYFRARFLADLNAARPQLFLDSIGPSSLFSPAAELAHDRNYPALAAVIRANYVLVDEINLARIYRRRDLVAGP